jgi:hypothetical protein
MAAVDPKELAQRNIPLIALYGVALAALPAWFVVVQGGVVGDKKTKGTVEHAKNQLMQKSRKIKALADRIKAKDKNDPVYNNNFKEHFEAQAKALREQSAKLSDLVRAKDQELEKWFEQFQGLPKGEEPDFNNFQQHWTSKAIPELKEEFNLIVTDPSDAELIYLMDDKPRDRKDMRFAQKRYWAQKYLLSAIRDGAKNGVGMTKPESEDEKAQIIPGRLLERIAISRPPGSKTGGGGGEQEEKPLVSSFRVNLKVQVSFRDASLIMSKVLEQPIPMQIHSFEITKGSFRIEDRKINLLVDGSEKVFPDDHAQILLDDLSQFKGEAELEGYVPEPSVMLKLEVDVLDFNAPEPKPKAAPPAEELPEDE